jgi:hypothetical protein
MRRILIIVFSTLILLEGFAQNVTTNNSQGNSATTVNPVNSPSATTARKTQNMQIEIFGQGNLIKSISEIKDVTGLAGFGVGLKKNLIESKNFERLEMEAVINVASNADSIKVFSNDPNSIRAFGSNILVPSAAKQSLIIKGKLMLNEWNDGGSKLASGISARKHISGIYWNLVASNRIWNLNKELPKKGTYESKINHGGLMGLNFGMLHELADEDWLKNGVSIQFGLGFIGRGIIGDLGQSINGTAREEYIGSKSRFFGGVEGQLEITLGKLKLTASLPYTIGKNHIKGLTGTQLVTAISFNGGIPIGIK